MIIKVSAEIFWWSFHNVNWEFSYVEVVWTTLSYFVGLVEPNFVASFCVRTRILKFTFDSTGTKALFWLRWKPSLKLIQGTISQWWMWHTPVEYFPTRFLVSEPENFFKASMNIPVHEYWDCKAVENQSDKESSGSSYGLFGICKIYQECIFRYLPQNTLQMAPAVTEFGSELSSSFMPQDLVNKKLTKIDVNEWIFYLS